jgi:hypothetical protein
MKKSYYLLWILSISGVLTTCGGGGAEDINPRLQKVLADWQKRQHQTETVEYHVRGEHKVPRGAYDFMPSFIGGKSINQTNPLQELVGKVGFTVLLDFVKGRHHRKIEDRMYNISSGNLDREVREDVFDGSKMKCLIPREDNQQIGAKIPELTIVSGDMKNGAFRSDFYPIFFGHGRISTAMEQIVPGRLRNKPDPEKLYIHGTGVHDGRVCLVLRTHAIKMHTTSFDEFWVDVPRDSAILRYVSYSGGKPLGDITVHYRKTSDGWLPENWRINSYVNGHLLYFRIIRVESFQFDVPVNDVFFEMHIKPGMIVEERADHATKHPLATPKSDLSIYRAGEGGVREYIPDPYHRKQGDLYQHINRRKIVWTWAWLALPLVAIAGLIFWAWRLKHNK